mgnify:CR=1 FL=1
MNTRATSRHAAILFLIVSCGTAVALARGFADLADDLPILLVADRRKAGGAFHAFRERFVEFVAEDALDHGVAQLRLKVVRSGKELRPNTVVSFLSQRRELLDEAYAGDIIGIPNHGQLRIGDALIEDRRHPDETQAFYARHLDRKSEDFAESIPYSVAQIERLFLERLVLDYDYVFCLTITSTRSPIFDHAMQASRAILTKYKGIRREAGMEERFGLAVFSTRNLFTGQAVLACKGIIKEPFAVINADDYYGKEAFVRLHDFLQGYTPDKPGDLAMAGFVLKNTLSDNGAVTRGICQMNDAHYLTGVLETSGIEKTADGAAAGGKSIDTDSLVSMNMWALTPEFVDLLESGFVEFFEKAAPANPLKAEYLLPIYIDELLHADKVSVKVLPTHDKWFGVTYAEDKQTVIDSFARLVADGVYKKDLFSDLKK